MAYDASPALFVEGEGKDSVGMARFELVTVLLNVRFHIASVCEWRGAIAAASIGNVDIYETHLFEFTVNIFRGMFRGTGANVFPQNATVGEVFIAICTNESILLPSEWHY